MNETPLTHNPMKQNGPAGRRKSLLITGAIVLALIAIAAIAYSVYAWQQNRQLSSDVSTKNTQIADLQKQKTTSSSTPTTSPTTTPADPYAGWQSATLKYEKLNLKYPSTWKLTDTSTPYNGNNIMATPGNDAASLTSPTGLTVTVATGVNSVGDGPYSTHPQFIVPIATLGGNYYLGFGTGPAGDTSPVNGAVGTSSSSPALYPASKNISAPGGPSYDIIRMTYNNSTQNGVSKPLGTYQNDTFYNDALLIIKSLSY
ncbi:hypothetical protein ACIQBJ_32130 [Kitasatospora sp. NPDC088391]|uniref:hypothetical protein n=1 Tax=Kitasatospora sp. NPDC088391 TaxID=3364074 RepID=UPI003816F1B8